MNFEVSESKASQLDQSLAVFIVGLHVFPAEG